MGLIFLNGQLLMVNNQLAMDPACCCGGCCCPNVVAPDYATLTATVTGGSISETVSLAITGSAEGYCATWTGATTDLTACSDSPIPLSLVLRCPSNSSPVCGSYLLNAAYGNSGCVSITGNRSSVSCTCDPLSIVFEIPGPANDPPKTGCNCPEASSTLTVTITL